MCPNVQTKLQQFWQIGSDRLLVAAKEKKKKRGEKTEVNCSDALCLSFFCLFFYIVNDGLLLSSNVFPPKLATASHVTLVTDDSQYVIVTELCGRLYATAQRKYMLFVSIGLKKRIKSRSV